MQTRHIFVGLVLITAALLVLCLAGRQASRRYPLTVSFVGYTNIDKYSSGFALSAMRVGETPDPGGHSFGRCARLAVTNNESSSLQFHSLRAEYEVGGRWQRAYPRRWWGLHEFSWPPGKGAIVEVSVPPEIPPSAHWRIGLVSAIESRSRLRAQLNVFARRVLRANDLAFYSPVFMLTSEIPPVEPNQHMQPAPR
jgi:hypothetical protein